MATKESSESSAHTEKWLPKNLRVIFYCHTRKKSSSGKRDKSVMLLTSSDSRLGH